MIRINEAKSILNIGTEFAEKAYHLVTYYLEVIKKTPFHEENYDQVLHFHDVCVVMYLLKPELFKGQDCYVEVALEGITSGATVVDYTNRTDKAPNVHVLHTVNREEFVAEFVKAVEIISDRLK